VTKDPGEAERSRDRAVRSAYLGQYTDEVANMIAGELEAAKIAWSYKQAGSITKIFFLGEWGTRLFVDEDRLDAAKRIAQLVEERTRPR
jgi:hypothetical protein